MILYDEDENEIARKVVKVYFDDQPATEFFFKKRANEMARDGMVYFGLPLTINGKIVRKGKGSSPKSSQP